MDERAAQKNIQVRTTVINYPEETNGSRMARTVRLRCNHLTDEEREAFFRGGMAIIYGSK